MSILGDMNSSPLALVLSSVLLVVAVVSWHGFQEPEASATVLTEPEASATNIKPVANASGSVKPVANASDSVKTEYLTVMPRPFVEYLAVEPRECPPELLAMPRIVPEPVEILNAFQALTAAATSRKPFLLLPADYATMSSEDISALEKGGVIVGRRSRSASDPWKGFSLLNGPNGEPWHLLPAPIPGQLWPQFKEMVALVEHLTPTLKSGTGHSRILREWHKERYFEKVLAEAAPGSRPDRLIQMPDRLTPDDRKNPELLAHWLMTHLHAKPRADWLTAESLLK